MAGNTIVLVKVRLKSNGILRSSSAAYFLRYGCKLKTQNVILSDLKVPQMPLAAARVVEVRACFHRYGISECELPEK